MGGGRHSSPTVLVMERGVTPRQDSQLLVHKLPLKTYQIYTRFHPFHKLELLLYTAMDAHIPYARVE